MFIDEAKIFVKAGDGGNGCVSFRREKFVPRGGPNGGDGGRGGSVILQATDGYTTLLHLKQQPHHRAKNGEPGRGKDQHGKSSLDLIIPVPLGTMVYFLEKSTQTLKDVTVAKNRKATFLIDLDQSGKQVVVAQGGRGGLGNANFATSTNQAPRYATPGKIGEQNYLKLELKLIADVALVGFPNVGKSTLISALSKAKPRIADYPFTTLEPHLGVVAIPERSKAEPPLQSFVMADIPGLIENAHLGQGLGTRFLRHIERTKIILHLVDLDPYNNRQPDQDYQIIRRELASYSQVLAEKPELIVATKVDLDPEGKNLQILRDFLFQKMGKKASEILVISALKRTGLKELVWAIFEVLQKTKKSPRVESFSCLN